MSAEQPGFGADGLPAGEFLPWLRATREALERGRGVEVPCGDCNACCRASYFIHVGDDEAPALEAIPTELLVPAPGTGGSRQVLGYDRRGRCPMLRGGACSVYEARPLTCRSYDCRVFAAAGILPELPERRAVAERVRRWRFSCPTSDDVAALAAVRAAAAFLEANRSLLPEGFVPGNATQLAVLAIKVFDVFLEGDGGRPPGQVASAVLCTAEAFEETVKSGPGG